jgi:Domain of unknown function (DUF4386)
MTTRTNARIAGATFLLYIVAGITSMNLFGSASRGADTAAKLASIAANAGTVRATVLLTLLIFAIAVTLAVALYALTRDVDRDLALLALAFRFSEGVLAAVGCVHTLSLLSLATATTDAASIALGGQLLRQGAWTGEIAAICFALGSTIFCWLFLRARSIPAWLSWLGIAASLLLVVALPVNLAGALPKSLAWPIWMPMLVFELTFAVWLLIKGVRSSPWTA